MIRTLKTNNNEKQYDFCVLIPKKETIEKKLNKSFKLIYIINTIIFIVSLLIIFIAGNKDNNIIFMILLAISIFLFFIDIIYSQVNYIMVEEQEIKVIECMKKSRKMMKGFKFKYFKLQISFIGWWIFSIFTLGIATLWVNPYSMLANANFYEEVKNINVEV